MRRPRFTIRATMAAVAVISFAYGGISWLTRGACLEGMVVNAAGSAVTDVRVAYLGSTRRLGDLAPWQAYRLGRFAYGWTDVAVSYVDGRGKRVGATRRLGVDLRRPVKAGGDSGQAVIEVGPTGVTTSRRHWVSW